MYRLLFIFVFLFGYSYSQNITENSPELNSVKQLSEGLKSGWEQTKIENFIIEKNLEEYIFRHKDELLSEFDKFDPKFFLLLSTASVFNDNLEYDEAQSLILHALKLTDEFNVHTSKAYLYNMLGNIYGEMKLYDEGVACFYKGISYLHKYKNYKSLPAIYGNFAGLFYKMGQSQFNYLDSARLYLNKSIALCEKQNDQPQLQRSYQTLGLLETDLKHFTEAEKAFKIALSLNRLLEDSMMLGYTYYQMGRSLSATRKEEKAKLAIKFLDSSLVIANRIHDVELMEEVYYEKAYAYSVLKDYKLSSEFALRYAELNDSLTVVGNAETIAELNKKYETAKKEAEIKDLNLSQQEKQTQIKRQNYILIASIIILVFVIIAVVVLYKSNQLRKRINNQLNDKNKLIEFQKKEVEIQKDLVETKNKEILDSINYARRIQYTLLAHSDFLNSNLKSNFVFFKPKDIVSGDFYWATKKQNRFYIAVCDCTGHGVPGAFMSLLNIGFLNEAINEKNIEAPHEIFNYVRKRLIESISKDEQKDGMDGVLLCINKENDQITYAAANNAPVLISENTFVELECDKMPVGVGVKEGSFRLFTVPKSGTAQLYLYTDGFADQFGGPKGKKFKYRQLNELILSNHQEAFSVQQQRLITSFENWKNSHEQVDDVCVLGFEI